MAYKYPNHGKHTLEDDAGEYYLSAFSVTANFIGPPPLPTINLTNANFAAVDSSAAPTASYSTSTFPYNCVCYITTSLGQGSGVIIGPHTILTASHMFWDADFNQSATSWSVYPGYSVGLGLQPISGQSAIHYFQINDQNHQLTQAGSQNDFAIIDFATDLSAFGAFGIQTNYPGGTVHLTGYPAIAGGSQTDQVGTVSADPFATVLNYGSVAANPGNSGGPVWIDKGILGSPQPFVVGVVSTTGWAAQITSSDLQTIQSWESSDSFLWEKPDLAINSVSISASSFVSGGVATLLFHVANNGTADAGASVSKIYLSTDSTIDASDTLLSAVAVSSLQKGSSVDETVTVTLPANVASGVYWVGVVADANGQVAETNESNNTASTQVTLLNPDANNIAQLAGVTTYHSMYNAIPSLAEVDVLTQFGQSQFSYGNRIGVLDPSIYLYQALGLALASQSDTGSTHWRDLNNPAGLHSDVIPNTVGGDIYWATSAYRTVFGYTPAALQVQHFEDQIVFFKNLYQNSGAFGSDGNAIDLLARGAVYGQMIGIAEENHITPGLDLLV